MARILRRSNWQIMGDVVFALFVREIRTGFNDRLGISWAVVQPVLFILILAFLRGRIDGGDTHGIPTFVFMAYGLILVQLFLQVFQCTSQAINKNKALYAFRQVQPISCVAASALFEILVKIFVVIALATAMYFLQIETSIADPLSVILCLFELWLFATAMGLIFGVAAMYVAEIAKLQSFLTRPLFFISGVFFSLQDIPQEYWYLLDWNPILHAIELSRGAAYPIYGTQGVSHFFLTMVTLTGTFFALVGYQVLWKKGISR